MKIKLFTVLTFSFTLAALAEDFKTTTGKEYRDATITRVEPDGIVVKSKSGVTKLYFTELPTEVQEHFHYDSEKAASYSAEQAAKYGAYQKQQEQEQQKQQEENRRQQETVTAHSAKLQAAWNRSRDLQDRYLVLQQEESALLLRIGEAEKPGSGYWVGKTLHHYPNPRREELPLLKSRLSDVRHEKHKVREQLNKTQQ